MITGTFARYVTVRFLGAVAAVFFGIFTLVVLIDYIDFVVHVFHPAAREFYQLERLWGDAPTQVLEA